MDTEALSTAIGYSFNDRELLRQALTHRSYGTPHNERLEFLGDSVLNCAIARELYLLFPMLTEGELSRVRANLVKQQTLADLATALKLGDNMRLGEGELKSGGFRRPSILADALEAVLGAVFLDGGFDGAQRVVRRIFSELLAGIDHSALGKDPKTLLQEHLQSRHLPLPQYTVVATRGEAHEQQFQVECAIPELNIRSLGEGTSRRSAEQNAARIAYGQAAGD